MGTVDKLVRLYDAIHAYSTTDAEVNVFKGHMLDVINLLIEKETGLSYQEYMESESARINNNDTEDIW